jgi:DNA-binding Xre family transcriptional regulator
MPYYSSHTASGYLVNKLQPLLNTKGLSSFALSKIANLSPTTTRKVFLDPSYIPSPDVLEKLCITLECNPGDLLGMQGSIDMTVAVSSGVL